MCIRDRIVRGGGPSENLFYLDGIEIPVINHFATQGSSGGVVGVVNPDFVREISFYTGAFPANRPNTLSSVMEIRQKDGSRDRVPVSYTHLVNRKRLIRCFQQYAEIK